MKYNAARKSDIASVAIMTAKAIAAAIVAGAALLFIVGLLDSRAVLAAAATCLICINS
jgi:hypothetical protein